MDSPVRPPRFSVSGRRNVEVADIFRAHGESYRRSRRLSSDRLRVMRDVEACRTAALGGHLDVCNTCSFTRPSYNSCRNRHCPKCQGLEQARWIVARKERILPVPHFHVVFTLPQEVRALARINRKIVFDILFETAARTLLKFSADEKWVGGQPGLTVVLHTWTRDLRFHPHVHCVITDGGLTTDGHQWKGTKHKGRFLFPVKAVSRVFRAKFVAALARARKDGKLVFAGACAHLASDKAFAALKDVLFENEWVVYAKRPFRGAEHLFEYLGRYTHRVAISNQRILGLSEDHVTFRANGDETTRLHVHEFIRRFLLHVLPSGFVKIRHYGLYASGNVKTRLRTARALLTQETALAQSALDGPAEELAWHDFFLELTGVDLQRCPHCEVGLMQAQPLDWRPRPDRLYAPAPPES